MNTFNPLAMLNSRPALATADAQNKSWNWSSLDHNNDDDDDEESASDFSPSHHAPKGTFNQSGSNRNASVSNTTINSSLNISTSSLPKRPSPGMPRRGQQRKMSSIDALKRNLALMDASSSSSMSCFGLNNKQLAQEDADASRENELPVIVVRGTRRSSSSRLNTIPVSASNSLRKKERSGDRRGAVSCRRRSSSTPKTYLELHIPHLAEMAGDDAMNRSY